MSSIELSYNKFKSVSLKGCPCIYRSNDLITLEKLHQVKFQACSYKKENACRDFINIEFENIVSGIQFDNK